MYSAMITNPTALGQNTGTWTDRMRCIMISPFLHVLSLLVLAYTIYLAWLFQCHMNFELASAKWSMWEETFSSCICSLAHLQNCCSQKCCQGLKETTQNTGTPGQAGSFPGITGSRDWTAKPKTPGLCLSQLRTPSTCLSSLCGFCWPRGTERGVKMQTPVGLF